MQHLSPVAGSLAVIVILCLSILVACVIGKVMYGALKLIKKDKQDMPKIFVSLHRIARNF